MACVIQVVFDGSIPPTALAHIELLASGDIGWDFTSTDDDIATATARLKVTTYYGQQMANGKV